MTETYFLGANSENGFVSYYDGFADGDDVLLHIIKGGPGGGKSGFMRRLGEAAEARGMDVEYVLCSGDPDSLDGVYIPAIAQAWVDGTAPHVIEPAVFAANSDYVNLGRFCAMPFSAADRIEAINLNRAYKLLYGKAYSYLSAAAAAHKSAMPESNFVQAVELERRIREIISRYVKADGHHGRISKRFISAHSCLGKLVLKDEINKLCKLIFAVEAPSPMLLCAAADFAAERGADVIVCSCPLCPAQAEAILLPEYSLAFACSSLGLDADRCVAVSGCDLYPRTEEAEQLEAHALKLVYGCLEDAKALHDALEAVYRPYIDFKSLDRYTADCIGALFA